jgi:hypothetical protein
MISHIESGTTTSTPKADPSYYLTPTSPPLTGGACVTKTRTAIDAHCYLQTGTRPICGEGCVVTWGVWWAYNTVPILVGVVCIFMFFFSLSLLSLHVYLLATNQTTWEVSSGPPKNSITYLLKAQTSAPFDDGVVRNCRVALLAAALAGDVPRSWCYSSSSKPQQGLDDDGMFQSSSDDSNSELDDTMGPPPVAAMGGGERGTAMEEGRAGTLSPPSPPSTARLLWPSLTPLGWVLGMVGRVWVVCMCCCTRGMRYLVRRLEGVTKGKSYCELRTPKRRWRELVEQRGLSRNTRHLVATPPRRWRVLAVPNEYVDSDTLEIQWYPF